MLFVGYPGCSTSRKAQQWLDTHGIPYTERNIKTQPPTYAELSAWRSLSGLPLKRFFNTSGMAYRSLDLKDRLPSMDEEAQLRLLATDGMLVKRPILVDDARVLVGFREAEWADALSPA